MTDTAPDSTTATQHLIQTRGLVKAFGVLPAVRKLDLAIDRGEFVALLGPNGSGKSTLIRLLAGLSRPTAGEIIIGGWSIPREAGAVRSQIGLVSHKPLLYENLTARENLEFFGRLYHLPGGDSRARIDELLDRVGLAKRASDLVRGFSRGMQQRLSIARALLHDPDVLLLDEPYSGLDQDASALLDDLLRVAHAEGRTILMTTHLLDRAARLSNRAVILARGSVVHDGATNPDDPLALAAVYSQVTGMAGTR